MCHAATNWHVTGVAFITDALAAAVAVVTSDHVVYVYSCVDGSQKNPVAYLLFWSPARRNDI